MKDCTWWNGHDWTKWEQFKMIVTGMVFCGKQSDFGKPGEETWQKRKCLKCGYEQRKEIC